MNSIQAATGTGGETASSSVKASEIATTASPSVPTRSDGFTGVNKSPGLPSGAMVQPTLSWDYVLANPVVLASGMAAAGALSVGLLTLFGVWLSLRAAHNRMKAEISAAELRSFRDRERMTRESTADRAHTSAEAARDRDHSAVEAHKTRILEEKTKVYGKVIDDFAAATSMLGRLPDKNLGANSDYQGPLLNLGASINKAWLLSEPDTALSVRELHARLNEIFLDFLPRSMVIQQVRSRIEIANRELSEAKDELARITAERVERGRNDFSQQGASLQAMQTRCEAKIEQLDKELSRAHEDNVLLTATYGKDLLRTTGELGTLIQAVVLAGRKELGLSSESSALKQQTVEMQRRMEDAYARVVQAM